MPPHKLAALRSAVSDKASKEAQRISWEMLRKAINGLVNKVNVGNMANILPELFHENLVRGRGLLCRSVMKAQLASPGFTHIYAALVAVVNTKLPEFGELVLTRVVIQFRRAFKRNNKIVAVGLAKFIAHLVNQQVAHELLALQVWRPCSAGIAPLLWASMSHLPPPLHPVFRAALDPPTGAANG